MSVEQLRRRRGTIKAKLTLTKNFATRVTEDLNLTTKEELKARIQRLDEAYTRFQEISEELVNIVPEEEYQQRDVPEEEDFDDRYFVTRASLMQSLERLTPQTSTTNSGSGQSGDGALTQILEQQATLIQQLSERSNDAGSGDVLSRILEQQGHMLEQMRSHSSTPRDSHVKLLIIKLPIFTGNIEEWKRYADTFKSLIHESELSNVQKHQYLVGSLSGPAAKVIESVEISDQNYQVAWELLKKRYEDERAIRKRYVQCLFEVPRVHKESASAIRELVDHIQKHLRVLHSMDLPTESWGELIIHLIENNLDNVTRRRWEEHAETKEELKTDDIIDFLQRRCQILERASFSEASGSRAKQTVNNEKSDSKQKMSNLKSQGKVTLSTAINKGRCYMCQGQHLIYSCHQFLNLSVEDKIKAIKRLKLCLNCFRNDHFVANCKAASCRECGERHNTLCHQPMDAASTRILRNKPGNHSAELVSSANARTISETPGILSGDITSGPAVHHTRGEIQRNRVLMSTAIVNVAGYKLYNYQLRALLDSASEVNFITISACKQLGLKLDNVCQSISGLSNMTCTIEHSCQLRLKSRTSDFELNLCCLVIPKIAKELPSFSIDCAQLHIPGNINLADPFFYNPSKIDILIGGEFFFKLLETERIELSNNLPTLQNSKFGWIISGPIPDYLITNKSSDYLSSNYSCLFVKKSIDETLLKFWELEEYPAEKTVAMSTEEQRCEDYFVNTMIRDVSGRFVVRLPFRENKNNLGDSREI